MAYHHDMSQAGTARPYLGDHAQIVRSLQPLSADEQPGARLIEHELEFPGAVSRVDVDQDRADLGRRVLGDRPFRAVRRPDTYPVALLDPHFQQPERQRIDVSGEFRIGPPSPGLRVRPVDERLAVAELGHGSVEVAPDRVPEQGSY